ncbi:hypothetical protein [Streptomyces sp. NPDC101776]|uniref:hypothetical protein n=1 Tax=Streptomyces sp. NPDC101776 TaxID=3366146 RepID=UPI003807622C
MLPFGNYRALAEQTQTQTYPESVHTASAAFAPFGNSTTARRSCSALRALWP